MTFGISTFKSGGMRVRSQELRMYILHSNIAWTDELNFQLAVLYSSKMKMYAKVI